ncbi:DUF1566 domain-containing protein [Flavobacterium sp. LT1R49]|uniref:Lcl C-terminal domain-containing protein n=1 Tax=Flavobacterium arabinosi TaxID=3398737 RepID=UPI003A8BD916
MNSKLLLLSFLMLLSVEVNYARNPFKSSNSNLVVFNSPALLATLTTTVSSTYTSAILGGNITNDGGATVTERGVVYSLITNPTTSDTKVVIGSGTGAFSQAVSGLTSSTTYYVRSYAINSQGTSYGSELSFTTAAFCGGDIIGSGYGTNPFPTSGIDGNWKVVALPQGYTYSETLPYNAYVPKTTSLAPVYIYVNGYTVSGSTYYWIAPRTDAAQLLGSGVFYNWIVQQTFNVAQSGFYDLNFSGAGDNAISFYINGVIDTTNPVKPKITGGTQIGARFDSFTSVGTFSGVTYLNAGINTASMVMEDWGGATTALISGSTFTCNTSYINVYPTLSSISDATIIEGSLPTPIAFTISDQETPLNNLTITASSSNTALIPNGNISLQGNTGSRTITLTPISGEMGTSTITITLDDNSGGVVTKSFVVTMNPLVLNRYGKLIVEPLQAINEYGAEGAGKGQNVFGKSIVKPLPPKIGDFYQGGIIFFTSVDGLGIIHGLIAATADQGRRNTTWGNAAALATAYTGGGYTDWRLPNYDDLTKMYGRRGVIGTGTFDTASLPYGLYWSTQTAGDPNYGLCISFSNGGGVQGLKSSNNSVRAIRSF